MKTILVPVDFSVVSDHAVLYAADIASKIKASVLLLHTYHAGEVTLDPYEHRKSKQVSEILDESGHKMAGLVSLINKAGVEASFLTEFGPLLDVMTDVIREKEVDLVIMGTSGSKGYLDILFGTKAARIIEQVNCPVITIPMDYSFRGMDIMVFATDFHDNDMAVMKFLAGFASRFNASIRAIHVSKMEGISNMESVMLEKFRKEVTEKISYENISFEIFNGGSVADELEHYILETGADLLVMSTHHRGPFDHLFESSQTRKIAMKAHIPLLAFHYKDEPTYFF